MDIAAENTRSGSRTPVSMDVTLIAGHGVPFHGTLANISFGGAYVETQNKALMPRTPLTIILQQQDGDEQRIFRMMATVERQDKTGAGISFDDYDVETVRSLRAIYKKALTEI
jgi:hypothetical protein